MTCDTYAMSSVINQKLQNSSIYANLSISQEEKDIAKIFKLQRKSQLNKVITNKDNSPDYLAINIYFDTLRSWYNPKKLHTSNGNFVLLPKLKTKGIFLKYKNLANTHGCSEETIRKKLVKLEKLGLIQRSFQHKYDSDNKSYNQLIVYVWNYTPFFSSEFGISKDDVPYLTPQTNHQYITDKYDINYFSNSLGNKGLEIRGGIHTPEDTKELINSFSKEKDISIKKSNFSKIIKEKNNIRKHSFFRANKTLADFYPLSKEDCILLQKNSGREFSLNAMNQILLDMSKRMSDRFFRNKKSFIKYMSKVFQYEMRDAVKISGENFKIRSNQTKEDKREKEEEKYLSEIENTLQINPEWHLKKKLSCVLERSKAYKLLKSYRSISREGDNFQIKLDNYVELSSLDREIISDQVKATHTGLEGNYSPIEKVIINMPSYRNQNEKLETLNQSSKKFKGIWGNIRERFTKTLGEIGESIDMHWISKLKSFIDKEKKIIILHAPSEFIRSYIEERYLREISSLAREMGYVISDIQLLKK